MHILRSSLACCLLMLSLVPTVSTAQDLTTVILIRHAEKQDSDNPPLSKAGRQRAKKLAEMLSQTDVTAIYATPYKRTEQTIRPLAKQKELDIISYDPFNKSFIDSMLVKRKGGTVVICGHSNTTPLLANLLLGEQRFEQFDESDYGNILILTIAEKGNAKALRLRY